MYSSLIGKIEKAKRYAQERRRVRFTEFVADFQGENSTHHISYLEGSWRCSCGFFNGHGVCSHTLAIEQILQDMVPTQALPAPFRGQKLTNT